MANLTCPKPVTVFTLQKERVMVMTLLEFTVQLSFFFFLPNSPPSLACLVSYLQRKPVWSIRVLLFWLFSCSQTSAVHSSVSLSLSHPPPPSFHAPTSSRNKENHRLSLPPPPFSSSSLLEIRHILPVVPKTQQNNSWIQNGPGVECVARQLRCVVAAYGACRMWAMTAMYFTGQDSSRHCLSNPQSEKKRESERRTQWRGIQPGTWLTHTESVPGHYHWQRGWKTMGIKRQCVVWRYNSCFNTGAGRGGGVMEGRHTNICCKFFLLFDRIQCFTVYLTTWIDSKGLFHSTGLNLARFLGFNPAIVPGSW